MTDDQWTCGRCRMTFDVLDRRPVEGGDRASEVSACTEPGCGLRHGAAAVLAVLGERSHCRPFILAADLPSIAAEVRQLRAGHAAWLARQTQAGA